MDYNIKYFKGAIIGDSDLVDCILVNDEFINMLRNINTIVYEKSNHAETYVLKLENIIKYEYPILCKGKLGVWNFD